MTPTRAIRARSALTRYVRPKVTVAVLPSSFNTNRIPCDWNQFAAGSSEILALPCEHFFCKACILPWLEKTNSCPVCRHELEAEEPADVPPPPPPPTHSAQWGNDNPLAMAARSDLMDRRRPMAARVRAGGPGGQEGIVVFPFDDGRESQPAAAAPQP